MAANLADLYANDLVHGLRLLDANWQFSWSHNLDTALLGAGFLAAIAGSRGARAKRTRWYSTALILGMFFLDEATPLHATIDQLRSGKLLYVRILLRLVLVLWLLAGDSDVEVLRRRARNAIAVIRPVRAWRTVRRWDTSTGSIRPQSA